MLRCVYRASRRFALAFTLISSGTLVGSASASDGLSPELVDTFFDNQGERFDSETQVQPVSYSYRNGGEDSGGVLARLSLRDSLCGDGNSACPPPWWAHRDGAFGEFLYLTAGSSDLIYAVEGTEPNPAVSTPTGPLGIVQMSLESGYRTGFTLATSDCSSLNVAYASWGGRSSDAIQSSDPANLVLNAPLQHPSLINAGYSSLGATATHRIEFQTLDLNYRHLWKQTDTMAVNWLAGVRYGNLEQRMSSQQDAGGAAGLDRIDTKIDFEGFGVTGGLDLERYSCHTGLFIYGKGMASLLAGDWKATYRQTSQFLGGEAANRYEDFHATPILEGEVGLGWRNQSGRVRVQSGFMMAGWYESVTTRSYIDAVTTAQLVDIGEAMTFSGLTSRVTFSF